MTDKQIIIDGVDVSGCSYYADGKCTNSHMIQSNCKNVAVCYYKQLKRKEQECETLKEEYTRVHSQLMAQEAYMLVDGEEVWSGPTRKLKQENEKLKAENSELKYKAEFFENYNNAHINKIMKLEKILTEIKEFCGIGIVNGLSEEQYLSELRDWQAQILQKISECEGNNDLEN